VEGNLAYIGKRFSYHKDQLDFSFVIFRTLPGLNFAVTENCTFQNVEGPEQPAKVNQQPPMHQLAVLSTGWAAFFHSVPDGVHHSPFLFVVDHCTFFFFGLFFIIFSLDLTSHITTPLTFLPS
jgi:hypothetical protein